MRSQRPTIAGIRYWLAIAGPLVVVVIVFAARPEAGAEPAVYIEGQGTYASIEAALDAASKGDVIRVRRGTYRADIVIDESITMAADGAGEVWIDGECQAETGIRVNADGVRLSGISVRNTVGAAVEVRADNAFVQDMRFEGWNCRGAPEQLRAGLACWYCSHLTVVDSSFRGERSYGNAVWVKSNSSRPSQGGHVIARNQIEGGFDAIGSETESDDQGGFHSDTVIEDNEIRDCWDDGIQVEGRNENVRVRRNSVQGCSAGIALSPNLVGPLLIEENVIEDLTAGFYDQQACFKVGRGGSGVTYLTGNVCRTEGDGIKQSNPGLSRLVVTGNCFQVTRYVIDFSGTPPDATALRDNVMRTSDPERFIKWGGVSHTPASIEEEMGEDWHVAEEPRC